MTRPPLFLVLFLVLFLASGHPALAASPTPSPRALQQQAYVWQRLWSQPVQEAVRQHGSNFSALVVLAAEISVKKDQPQVTRCSLDYDSLRLAGTPVGLALRVGAYSGPFASNAPMSKFIRGVAQALLNDANRHRLTPAELQLDFDCAESKLDGYRLWVESLREQVVPVPVTITALPAWLKQPAFPKLLAATDGYVLQVHSLHQPKDFDAPFSLCDPDEARRAVDLAGKLPVRFRVALPTYGYTIAFDPHGKFIGLSAEGPAKAWAEGTRLREVRSDPVAIAKLVQNWATNRPPTLQGIIWYRLLISHDTLNWRWPTLRSMMALRSPRESVRAESRRVEPGLVEISLVNDGELDFSSRLAVEVRWQSARLVAGDGLRGFQTVNGSPFAARFQPSAQLFRLPAGESQVIGWLRLSEDREVQVEFKKL